MNPAIRNYKLTPEKVILARSLNLYNPKIFSSLKIASMLSIGRNTAWMAISGNSWQEVPFPTKEDATIIARGYLYDY